MSTIKPREAEVVIYQGDDLAHLSDLRRVAEAAERRAVLAAGAPQRLGDKAPSADAEKAAYDAFVDEAAERAVVVKVRAIGRKRFRHLMLEHPPRKVDGETHEDDAPYEVNVDTFPEALLSFRDGDTSTIVSPEFGTSAAVRNFLDNDIADGDFDSLWVSAYFLNRAPSADPKASRFSTASPRPNET